MIDYLPVDSAVLLTYVLAALALVIAPGPGVLNPKVAVFFLAFLPQFVRPERGAVLAVPGAGLVLSTLGFIFDVLLAVIAGRARTRLTHIARPTLKAFTCMSHMRELLLSGFCARERSKEGLS